MRCKFCLQTFTQPSLVTKETRLCSICRGLRRHLKQRDLCERTPRFLVERRLNKTPKVVYHATSKESAQKIIEFGFDRHLSGQGCRRRLTDSNPSRINDDFVEFLETMPENRVINACINPEKIGAAIIC